MNWCNDFIFFLVLEKGNVLFNDALNTFNLQLHSIRHGKGAFSKRGILLLPLHGLLVLISSKVFFICSLQKASWWLSEIGKEDMRV